MGNACVTYMFMNATRDKQAMYEIEITNAGEPAQVQFRLWAEGPPSLVEWELLPLLRARLPGMQVRTGERVIWRPE